MHTTSKEQFAQTLQHAGMRLTPQKEAIYNALMASTKHPSAEELHASVREQFPTLSLATVYDNVKKLQKLGLCTEMFDKEGIARYDGNMHVHHHVLHEETGEIHDVYVPATEHIPLPEGVDPQSIKEIRITYIT